jgi:hypothetical protein
MSQAVRSRLLFALGPVFELHVRFGSGGRGVLPGLSSFRGDTSQQQRWAELAEVLTAIIFRVPRGKDALARVSAYDVFEQTWARRRRPTSQAARITVADAPLEWRRAVAHAAGHADLETDKKYLRLGR